MKRLSPNQRKILEFLRDQGHGAVIWTGHRGLSMRASEPHGIKATIYTNQRTLDSLREQNLVFTLVTHPHVWFPNYDNLRVRKALDWRS